VPPKERLGADHEGRTSSPREDPADRGHEQPIPAVKSRATHLAFDHLQLVAKHHKLDFGIELFVG
jgi:hypothetical protein